MGCSRVDSVTGSSTTALGSTISLWGHASCTISVARCGGCSSACDTLWPCSHGGCGSLRKAWCARCAVRPPGRRGCASCRKLAEPRRSHAAHHEQSLGQAGQGGRVRDDHSCLRRSEEHTSELQSRRDLVCRLLLE